MAKKKQKPGKKLKKEAEKIQEETPDFSHATDSLMPELEELVKKNPNRLIGCGG